MLRNIAKEISGKEEVGKHWADRFIKRHKINIISRWADGMDRQRKRANSTFKYTLYFELLSRKFEEYDI
jgi:hypothetical protein